MQSVIANAQTAKLMIVLIVLICLIFRVFFLTLFFGFSFFILIANTVALLGPGGGIGVVKYRPPFGIVVVDDFVFVKYDFPG